MATELKLDLQKEILMKRKIKKDNIVLPITFII